jgi:hypothetical protein
VRHLLAGRLIPLRRIARGRNAALARWPVLALHPVRVRLPDANALANPDRIRAENTPEFAGAGQVDALPRPEREVLMIAGKVAVPATGHASVPCRARNRARAVAVARSREPVVRIWPRGRLRRIVPRLADAVGELR